jgi:hypothetical protein
MTALSGTIVASRIVPSDSLDAYATHDADYGRGGYRSVADITERDAIPDPRRKVGMKVWVNSESKEYQLIADITNGSWVEVTGGSGSSTIASLTDVVITAPTASQVLSYDEATSKWINTAATSSGGTWGSITGTLSSQTDLQTALDGKEPANANIQSHISSTANPHGVTAAQVGAYTTAQTDTLLNGKIDESREGIANGIATLDTNAKINLSQIPDSILGQVEYQGVWDMTTLPTPTQKGYYWIASVAGNGYEVGDWAVYNGSTFDKVDNTDAVSSVAGRTGNIVLNKNDVGLSNVDNTSDLNKPISIATQTALDLKAEVDDTTPTTTKVFSSDKTMELHNAQAQAIANKVDKIGANDIEVTDATKGVILKSANGTRFRITIADDGSLTTTAV